MCQRLVQFCLILTLCSLSSGLSCGWINFKFREFHGTYLKMLREMEVPGITEDKGDVHIFKHDWRKLFSRNMHSKPENQVLLVVQTLNEASELLSDAYPAHWSEKPLDGLLSVLENQADHLQRCVSVRMTKNNRLSLFFKHLRIHIRNNMDDQTNTWEQIRREVLEILKFLELFPALSPNHISAN